MPWWAAGRALHRRVHRKAMALDGQIELVAGALVVGARQGARASGQDLGLAEDRNHGSWQELLADELRRPPGERIDFVSIVTPNHVHFAGGGCLRRGGLPCGLRQAAGAHGAQADALVCAVARSGTVFGVTYNYTGYPMVREARAPGAHGRAGRGAQGDVEYNQGWLATAVEATATSRPAGAPTRRAAARPAPWATSARTPRTSRPRSRAGAGKHLRRPERIRRGPAA
jgi:predicted dehydrogenase